MMEESKMNSPWRLVYLVLVLCLILASGAEGQNINASISGTVTDSSGAVVPNANCTLRSTITEAVANVESNSNGLYRFGNLQRGVYDLEVTARGFQAYVQKGIVLNINDRVTVNAALRVGQEKQTVEVTGNASALNFEDATVQGTITPDVLKELPLEVAGSSRSAAAFVVLLPGVSTGATGDPFNARINGGMQLGGEATLDGASMQEGIMGQSGMNAIHGDYPLSPEAISEVNVLISNYSPQYGSSDSGVINLVTRSGTDKFHGDLREFFRNTVLNARQWGVPDRPADLENQFGASLGGPVRIPGIWSGRNKAYFFFNWERYTVRGGTKFPVLSIPSMKERQGDFSDWSDASGNLIPIYDPATTRPNPTYDPNQAVGPTNTPFLRDQFMGCNGNTPNVICPTDARLQNSLAQQWLQHLPTPNFPGPLNNFISPVPIPEIAGAGTDHRQNFDFRFDDYLGSKDHFALALHYHNAVFANVTNLPRIISSDSYLLPDGGEIGPWNSRLNWDHTFTTKLVNNLTYGYMNMRGSEIAVDSAFADQLPQIPGVASHAQPPTITFSDGFEPMGRFDTHHENRPTSVVNDLLAWTHGRHLFKFGGELRKLQNNFISEFDYAGIFSFSNTETGLLGINSGSSMASFLLDLVDNGSATFDTVNRSYARGSYWALFAGDTWKATSKLSVDYGLRWDLGTPATEKYNHSSFFDPSGANPGAGGRPGRLAFAGSGSGSVNYGAAGFSRAHPENTWYGGFAPRLGIAYAFSSNSVVRAGYGIFVNQAFYPGWGSGIARDGFNSTPSFSSTNGGLTPAFLLENGLPQQFQRPPFIDSSFLNGQDGPLYRAFDSNRRPYTQQWNLTLEHQFRNNSYVSAGYVGSKGTRLPSNRDPLNALNPTYLSMGQQLFDEFQPGQTTLDGVSVPYDGWVDQMQACAPSVAQALVHYPQYCGGILGVNENKGNSTYHSLQAKAEQRLSHGLWFLASYTLSKLITDADSTQSGMFQGGLQGVISPFQAQRNKALSVMDTPQSLSFALSYDLPFGRGKRFLGTGGAVDKVVGGWQIVSIFKATSGNPFYFRSSSCNVPQQFQAACIPKILPGVKPFLQDPAHFDPNKGPLFNPAAFEDPSSFNFYFGQGDRVSNLRGPGYHNEDVSLVKNTRITERAGLQFRAEFFNVFNWHILTPSGYYFGQQAFDTDVASPTFGQWTGSVSNPRNIQLSMQVLF
jgi:hypothetical protein